MVYINNNYYTQVYTHWISPLKEQLADVQKELRRILTVTASNSLGYSGHAKSDHSKKWGEIRDIWIPVDFC